MKSSMFSEAKSLATSFDCKYTETSASLNHNVDELLVGILTQIRLKKTTLLFDVFCLRMVDEIDLSVICRVKIFFSKPKIILILASCFLN